MKAALLPDRGVVKVAGADARAFLNGLLTTDVTKVTPAQARFGALLTPQGKIIVDCIVAEAPAEDGGGFFLDCPRALAPGLVEKLNFYKLRAKVICEDLSEVLGVMAVWDGSGDDRIRPGLCRPAAAGARPARDAAAASGQGGGGRSRRRAVRGGRLRGAPHRARRAARRARLHLRRRLPARDRHGPARRRRFRQGLLRRPGGGVAHGASRHRAHPHRAGDGRATLRPTPASR